MRYQEQRPPVHVNRRQLLQVGGIGTLGLALPDLLRAEAKPRLTPSIQSCVLFLLHGGPSQLDVWDLKPNAPAEVRGEFNPISTSVPGIQIVEHLPRLARLAHRYTIIRSMTHELLFHNTATYLVMTGNAPLRDILAFTATDNDFPHLGAQLAAKWRRPGHVPVAVSLPDPVGDGPYPTPGQNGGFLGAAYAPFAVYGDPNNERFSVDSLVVRDDVRDNRLAGRRSLLRSIDQQLGRLGDDRRIGQLDKYQQRAFGILTSTETRQAFELSRESPQLREQYGRHKYGQSLLLARRLVEAGVRLVTVYWGGQVNNPVPHWDTHFNNNRRLKDELLPPFDQCFSAFLEDLHQRGLLASTLVICMGEFGRTPRFGQNTGNGVDDTGRDHWAQCYSIVVAGGPASAGRVLGRSDRFAAYPADDPYTPQDLSATVLHALGVNPREEVRDAFGRAMPLSTGEVRESLIGARGS